MAPHEAAKKAFTLFEQLTEKMNDEDYLEALGELGADVEGAEDAKRSEMGDD